MLSHPLTITGAGVATVGFLLLIFWVPIENQGFGYALRDYGIRDSVFNMHRAEISRAVMSVGFVLVIVGVISRGFELVLETRNFSSTKQLETDSDQDRAKEEPSQNLKNKVAPEDLVPF